MVGVLIVTRWDLDQGSAMFNVFIFLNEVVKVVNVYLSTKLKVFADDITPCLEGRNKQLPDVAEKILRAMRI